MKNKATEVFNDWAQNGKDEGMKKNHFSSYTHIKKIIQSNRTIKFRKLILKKNVSKISVIGVGMITTPGVTFRMFQTLANKKINIQVISTSEIKISVLVATNQVKSAIAALHKEFKLD